MAIPRRVIDNLLNNVISNAGSYIVSHLSKPPANLDIRDVILINEVVVESWGGDSQAELSWNKVVVGDYDKVVVESWGDLAQPETSWRKIVVEVHDEVS